MYAVLRPLSSPASGWNQSPGSNTLLQAYLFQVVLVLVGRFIACPTIAKLSASLEFPSDCLLAGISRILVVIFSSAVLVLLANTLFMLLLWLAASVTGTKVLPGRLLIISTLSITPVFLAFVIGNFLLAGASPSNVATKEAMALLFRPFPLNPICWILEPFSLAWVLAAQFDPMYMWAMIIAGYGLRNYLALKPQTVTWIVFALVILWALTNSGMWIALNSIR